MNVFFLDPKIERFPPESVRLVDLRAEPYPDGRRVRVHLELTPFQKRPEIELELTDTDGNPCGSASLIEPMGWSVELTMHIRAAGAVRPPLTLTAILLYDELGETDRRQITFSLPVND